MFKKKIEFTEDEQKVFDLLGEDGIFFDAGNREHKKLRPVIGDLFVKGFIDRGKKALNHFVLNEIAKKAINHNQFYELFKTETK